MNGITTWKLILKNLLLMISKTKEDNMLLASSGLATPSCYRRVKCFSKNMCCKISLSGVLAATIVTLYLL